MFVLLKGASKETAFRVGKEIVDQVTALNPKPVKLKFEKVDTLVLDSVNLMHLYYALIIHSTLLIIKREFGNVLIICFNKLRMCEGDNLLSETSVTFVPHL